MNTPAPLQQIDRTFVRLGKRKLSYFAGCDYFRLASHPKVLRAAEVGLKKYGLNVAASRMTTGNHELYGTLETALGEFFESESATLVSSGYITNLIVAESIRETFCHVLIDEKAHPSLQDAVRLFGCPAVKFKHRDPSDLWRIAQQCDPREDLLVLTDGMFSHDGSIAPLKKYLDVLPKRALLLVDDAHGAGTLGPTGKGTPELENANRDRIIQTITLSKAFGVYGGAILAPRELREKILRNRMFVGSTPLPLPLANAAIESISVLFKDRSLRRRLQKNVSEIKEPLQKAGFTISSNPSPLLAILPQSAREIAQIKKSCLAHDVFPSFIQYPGGPENGYFRFAISSEHTHEQITALTEALLSTR